MTFETKVTEPMLVLAVRHVGPYHEIGEKFDQVMKHAQALQIPVNLTVGVYYDDPGTVPDSELRSDACLLLSGSSGVAASESPEAGQLHELVIPGGNHAVATHMGSYEGLGAAWGEFMTVMDAAGLKDGPGFCYEVYMNDCTQVPEAEVRTDMYASIEG